MWLKVQSREANLIRLSGAIRSGLNICNFGSEIIVFDDYFLLERKWWYFSFVNVTGILACYIFVIIQCRNARKFSLEYYNKPAHVISKQISASCYQHITKLISLSNINNRHLTCLRHASIKQWIAMQTGRTCWRKLI